MITIEELQKMREAEDHVEFKRAEHNYPFAGGDKTDIRDRRHCVLGYVVALANERGGKLVLGMEDKVPHTVAGSDFAHVLSIERQQKIKEELYLYLLNKREENALSQAITESNARVIDPATGSKSPVAPKSAMIMLAALIIGCLIPGGVFWLQAAIDTKVRSRKDVEHTVSLPFLGEIPVRDKKDIEEGSEIVIREGKRDSVSEAFRIVRSNMVCFIHRPEYYKITDDGQGHDLRGLAEIIIAKHRNGAVGTVYLRFLSNMAKFINLEDDIPVSREFTSKMNKDVPTPSEGMPPIQPSGADFLSGKSNEGVPF